MQFSRRNCAELQRCHHQCHICIAYPPVQYHFWQWIVAVASVQAQQCRHPRCRRHQTSSKTSHLRGSDDMSFIADITGVQPANSIINQQSHQVRRVGCQPCRCFGTVQHA